MVRPVLLVEDNVDIRAILSEVLSGAGFMVVEANHGEEALRLIQGHSGDWYGLVTDYEMPRMNGAALLREIAARQIHFERWVLMSAHDGISGYVEDISRILPGLVILKKPFTPEQLLQPLESAKI